MSQDDAVRIRKLTGGYIVSSAAQAPGDERVVVTFAALVEYLRNRFKEA